MLKCLPALLLIPLAAAQDLPIAGLGRVGFLTADLAKARDYYTGVLGYEEAFSIKDSNGRVTSTSFKVNEEQYIEIAPGLAAGQDARLTHIAIESTDIAALRAALLKRGVIPTRIAAAADGALGFSLKDPDGTRIEFVQYGPDSAYVKSRGQALGANRISTKISHAGVLVANLDAAMAFYRDKLGFQEFWRGGPTDADLRWINLRMPGSRGDYVEFMLYTTPPNRQQLGSMQHVCLEVPDIAAAHKTLLERGVPDEERHRPRVGRNGHRLLNVFDPDGTRTELMEPKRARGRR